MNSTKCKISNSMYAFLEVLLSSFLLKKRKNTFCCAYEIEINLIGFSKDIFIFLINKYQLNLGHEFKK